MPSTKEIVTKIKSIQSTQKITRAMEMVAASKMKKAQEKMRSSRPYFERIKEVIGHISQGKLEYRHIYTIERDIKAVGYLIVSTDRGLCGGLNVNLFKSVLASMSNYSKKNIDIKVSVIGKKGVSFFSKICGNIVSAKISSGDKINSQTFIGVVKVMLDLYENLSIDKLYLAYNEFFNTMTQIPKLYQLVPTLKITDDQKFHWNYIYEPDAEPLIDELFNRYIESLVYQGVVENAACEQAARMVAMKSASDNAGEIVSKCKLVYNKVRQASITQELSEIVVGAGAV
ncbi:MAG: F0F1 ATP synthase subunit gamma [Candidatus Azosocius agrarius]|nr:MAG: F0F1 ATP synthase subunit gamma [Gammaproteobacteria bacterium]